MSEAVRPAAGPSNKSVAELSPGEKRVRLAELMRRKAAAPKTVPLSFAQQRLWFLDQLSPGNAFYNVDTALPLNMPVDAGTLEKSLNEIVRRHAGLRTTFRAENGQPVQIVAPRLDLTVPVVDLRALAEPERQAEAHRLANQEAQRPFDLSAGPLIRATLLKLADAAHILLLTLHHIAADGWSMNVFFRELSTIYDAFTDGKPSPLPELPIQYSDFAVWQRGWLQADVLQYQLDYWKRQLADLPALQLPCDHPRPPIQTYGGAFQLIKLPAGLSADLKSLSQAEGVTLFMTLLAAFQILLSRYTGQEDVAVGTPIAGRNRVEVEALIGFFVNTLVLRTDLSADLSFRKLLGQVREVCLGAYAHQDLPFEMLVGELQPERDLSRNPLFQVMFQLIKMPSDEGADWTEPAFDVVRGTSIFDLALHAGEGPHGIVGNWEYSTELFERATILRMSAHLERLLEGIAADPDRPISQLRLLDDSERRRVLVEWNQTECEYPGPGCLHHLFEAQAARAPGAVALAGEGVQWSYQELDRRANLLAAYLRKLGVGADVPVVVSMERSAEMFAAVLGILKAGGAYVPLDPAYPRERRALILADLESPVVLAQERLREALAPHASRLVCLDSEWERIERENDVPAAAAGPEPSPANLAYVLYTSGSTGVPKGVAMSHGALVNLLAWQARNSTAGPGTRTLQYASLNFDVSCQEMFATWGSGGTLVLISEETRRDAVLLLRFLEQQRVERLFVPFVALNQLAEAAFGRDTVRPPIREIITAGEALRITPRIAAWIGSLKECTLFNQYGPTESHVVTAYTLAGPPDQWPALPPIGRPISNVQIYVLDRHLQPVPAGVPGDLYIGGAGLARGYWSRPELTADRFIPDPFHAGGRLYKTGDVARYRPDGNIEFVGRSDDQVKIRGYRVELGEVESLLTRHPGVREAVVIARDEESGHKRLVAYLVPSDPAPDAAQLRHCLLEHLPEYMTPSAFVFLDALPLLPNGKVNRRILPAPPSAGAVQSRAETAPRNPTEEKLAAIWSGVLGLERVGVHDNFFADLGGHSLLATQIVSRVRDAFGVDLPLTTIFEKATVASMAEWIDSRHGRDRPDTPIAPVARQRRRIRIANPR
ncbi:MAG: amino acid adenylation domain-containing protein [Candidatus Solibacter usitatus]|nr:amino acid adenylation domain-containing protein [Candidatus Solibacter usitatus]